MARDRVRPQPRALVVSPSVVSRTTHAEALEAEGFVAAEAASVDEARWALVAARAGDAPPIEVVVADLATPGVDLILGEARRAGRAPALVVLAHLPETAPPLPGAEVVTAGRVDDLRVAVERALARRGRRPTSVRVLLALDEPGRRAAAQAALTAAGGSVVAVADGLELLEVLGANLALAPVAWAPEVLIMDARLARLDGLDALAEVRELDLQTPAVLLAAPDDAQARAQAPRLLAAVLDPDVSPSELARVAFAARAPTGRVARPLRAG